MKPEGLPNRLDSWPVLLFVWLGTILELVEIAQGLANVSELSERELTGLVASK